jgi:dTDP-4-amino-4,6-dideoxygalactose transaminase
MNQAVPFLDLGPAHRVIKEELLADFAALIETGAFSNGPAVREFEAAFAAFCGVRRCVGTASGLDALRLALIAAGLEPGDEVVLPAMTFVATAEAVTQAGGRPVLADISEADYNLDVDATADAVTERTRFLLPVHLYGQLADMRALAALAAAEGLQIVEDACQAHGASREGIGAGTLGLASAFSFYPGKNLGAFGDAGALVTDCDELDGHVRALREHGQRAKYVHVTEGYTARLDTIQAIALLRKLPYLTKWTEQRVAIAAAYDRLLDGVGDLVLPPVAPGSYPVWHLYVVRTGDPAALGAFLTDRGIATGRHYPTPVHLTPAYRRLGYRQGEFPVAEKLGHGCLSLPLFPGMTQSQVEVVAEAVGDYFAEQRGAAPAWARAGSRAS